MDKMLVPKLSIIRTFHCIPIYMITVGFSLCNYQLFSTSLKVPGEGGDFGDGVQVEGGREGHVVMMDDVPMPCLNTSDSMR